MKLKQLTATFGKLEGETLALSGGLNIITAPNESGKSTWAGFLKAMLYGIDTKERDKKGYLADKNRYLPWSGTPMAGEISLEAMGRDITIRRWTAGATPFGKFSATYTATETPAPLTATTCGFSLCGVEREVFERSAFLASSSHAITAAPELERRIAALVASGDESISFSEVEERLKEWGRQRRVNKSVGLLPKLERQRAETEELLRQQAILNDEIATLSGEQVALAAQLAQLTAEQVNGEGWSQRQRNERYHAARQDCAEAERQLEAIDEVAKKFGTPPPQDTLRRWQGELAVCKSMEKEWKAGENDLQTLQETLENAKKSAVDGHFDGLNGDDAKSLAVREVARHQSLVAARNSLRHRPLIALLSGALAVVALIATTTTAPLSPSLAAGLNGGVGAVIGMLVVTAIATAGRKKRAISSQLAELLSKYGVDDVEKIPALADDYAVRYQAFTEAERALNQRQLARNSLRTRIDDLMVRILDFVHTFSPEIEGLLGASAALSRCLKLGEDRAVAVSRVEGARRLVLAMEGEGGAAVPADIAVTEPTRPIHQIVAQKSAVQGELRRVEDALAQLIGRQQASGDPAGLAAQLEQLDDEITRRQREFDAIGRALEGLRAANAQLQQRFSPQINQKAGEYLALLTGGRYQSLSLTREMEGLATVGGDIRPHAALALSRGTADQLYLAVRLAVCDLCLPEGDPVPLVLDDALVAFDGVRMERALDLLCQLAEKRQILLFTCHSRERDYLKRRPDVHCIELV